MSNICYGRLITEFNCFVLVTGSNNKNGKGGAGGKGGNGGFSGKAGGGGGVGGTTPGEPNSPNGEFGETCTAPHGTACSCGSNSTIPSNGKPATCGRPFRPFRPICRPCVKPRLL